MKKTEIYSKNKNSILLLAVMMPLGEGKGRISIRGTGFIVSEDGQFITSAHVYKEIPEGERKLLEAKLPEEADEKGITHFKTYKVKLIDLDEEEDIALMQLVNSGNKKKFIPTSKLGDAENVKEGDEIIFIGYPLATELLAMGFGLTLSANSCIVSSVKRRGKDGRLHFSLIDTHINKGSSGSPVFSVDTGKIIGMASGRVTQKLEITGEKRVADIPSNIGICRPSKYISEVLKKNEVKL